MFYYNLQFGRCEDFIYGGCGGNDNRFSTMVECRRACGKEEEKSVCTLPPVTGPCTAYIPSFYFNSKKGQCEEFIYGGCGGNDNRFSTMVECRRACGRKEEESVCTLPPVTGPCFAHIPSYYFNSKRGQCEQFIYGGCDGNDNRFSTMVECRRACGKKEEESVCTLPPVTGPCFAHIPSYYFNSKRGQCEEFIYGGCDGNDNRFSTMVECRRTCGKEEGNTA